MTANLDIVLLFIAIVLCIPSVILLGEVAAAFLPRQPRRTAFVDQRPKSIAILVPAHNESSGITATLNDISGQLEANDLLTVVADNCTDDTAAVAATHGAQVVVRHDTKYRGKAYALAFGLEFIAKYKPDIVIVVDADCRVGPDAIKKLAFACAASNRPIQALNLMKSPVGNEAGFAIAEFAWIMRNNVRPLGLANLGLPCQLMGTGMAFPWEVIRSINLASSNVVEDLELGINLARRGSPPNFCIDALVTSQFPITDEGIIKQRQRWEQGSLSMLLQASLRTILTATWQRNGPLLVLGLDMTVPPLAIHAAATLLAIVAFGIFYISEASSGVPAVIVTASGVLLAASVLLAWFGFGRAALPVSQLPSLLPYLFAKTRIYRGFGSRHSPEWVRSDRSKEK